MKFGKKRNLEKIACNQKIILNLNLIPNLTLKCIFLHVFTKELFFISFHIVFNSQKSKFRDTNQPMSKFPNNTYVIAKIEETWCLGRITKVCPNKIYKILIFKTNTEIELSQDLIQMASAENYKKNKIDNFFIVKSPKDDFYTDFLKQNFKKVLVNEYERYQNGFIMEYPLRFCLFELLGMFGEWVLAKKYSSYEEEIFEVICGFLRYVKVFFDRLMYSKELSYLKKNMFLKEKGVAKNDVNSKADEINENTGEHALNSEIKGICLSEPKRDQKLDLKSDKMPNLQKKIPSKRGNGNNAEESKRTKKTTNRYSKTRQPTSLIIKISNTKFATLRTNSYIRDFVLNHPIYTNIGDVLGPYHLLRLIFIIHETILPIIGEREVREIQNEYLVYLVDFLLFNFKSFFDERYRKID